MALPSENELLKAVQAGDDSAFARLYELYQERVRLAAWRVSHRPDWLDEIVNESWCRAFAARTSYDPARPFLVWMAGIVQNVYREQCRKSPLTLSSGNPKSVEDLDEIDPESVASEAELLSTLNRCVSQLSDVDAAIVRLRFFEDKPLRVVAKEVSISESTLRTTTIPAIMDRLRKCMTSQGFEISRIFSAQDPAEMQ